MPHCCRDQARRNRNAERRARSSRQLRKRGAHVRLGTGRGCPYHFGLRGEIRSVYGECYITAAANRCGRRTGHRRHRPFDSEIQRVLRAAHADGYFSRCRQRRSRNIHSDLRRAARGWGQRRASKVHRRRRRESHAVERQRNARRSGRRACRRNSRERRSGQSRKLQVPVAASMRPYLQHARRIVQFQRSALHLRQSAREFRPARASVRRNKHAYICRHVQRVVRQVIWIDHHIVHRRIRKIRSQRTATIAAVMATDVYPACSAIRTFKQMTDRIVEA